MMRHLVRARSFALGSLAVAVALTGCGGSSTGPAEDPDFATLDPQVGAEWCVRGTITLGAKVTEVLTENDCRTADTSVFEQRAGVPNNNAYFETWRLKVTGQRGVRIKVAGDFDSYLDIYRITDLSDPSGSSLVGFDDDSGSGRNARLIVSLAPSYEYWVLVSGYDELELGDYSLSVGRL